MRGRCVKGSPSQEMIRAIIRSGSIVGVPVERIEKFGSSWMNCHGEKEHIRKEGCIDVQRVVDIAGKGHRETHCYYFKKVGNKYPK